jgi:hypothetical protein
LGAGFRDVLLEKRIPGPARNAKSGIQNVQPTLKDTTALRECQPFDISHAVEWLVAEHSARVTGEVVWIPVGLFRDFDGITASKNLRFEVKCDVAAAESFNLAIERSYRAHPSGISATQANVWVHCVPIGDNLFCYEFDVADLRAALQGRSVVHGGDRGASELYLVPMAEAARIARRRFTIPMPNAVT